MITKYVNTAGTVGTQDGSTNTSGSSGTAAFACLDQAIDWINANDATLSDSYIIECCGTTADTTPVDVNVTSMNGKTILIRGNRSDAAGFYDGDAVISSNHYRLEIASTSRAISVNENDITLDGIQIQYTAAATFRAVISPGNNPLIVRKCRILGIAGGGTPYSGIGHENAAGGLSTTIWNIENTLIVGSFVKGIELFNGSFRNPTLKVLNCTIYGPLTGIRANVASNGTVTLTFKNNAIANCATADITIEGSSTITASYSNNADEDVDGTVATIDIGTITDAWTAPGTSASSQFSVKDTSSSLYNAGTTTGTPTDDITDTARDTTYDVGAFELIVSGGTPDPVTGTGSSTFDNFHSTGVGSPVILGTGSSSFSNFLSAGLGTPIVVGSGASTFGNFISTGVGTIADAVAQVRNHYHNRPVNPGSLRLRG